MTKPITGQYECAHRSGLGLDYFTSRVDRLTLQANGRFMLVVQDHSRIANAAQSLMSGQQVSTKVSEMRREGNYIIVQGNSISLRFDDGTQQQGQLSANGDGLQLGQDIFTKVSDSTLLPPTHRLKKDMEDIAKGIKIAGTVGGIVLKTVKDIRESVQSSAPTSSPLPTQPSSSSHQQQPAQEHLETLFCDQCGARCRPGKRFCNACGAQLP